MRGEIRLARRRGVVWLALALICQIAPAAAAPDIRARREDAFVFTDSAAGEWTIGNAAITYGLTIGRDGTLRVRGLRRAGAADPVTFAVVPDGAATIAGERIRIGESGSGFVVDRVDAAAGTHFVSLAVRAVSGERGIIATRHYRVYPGVPAVELWTTFESGTSAPRTLQDLNGFETLLAPGSIAYVGGLDVGDADGGPFARRVRVLDDGEHLAIGAPTMSTEATLPFFVVADGWHRVFGGIVWSGAWSAVLARDGNALQVSVGLPPMSAIARPGHPVEGPHAFLGVVPDMPGAETEALSQFVHAGRAGRPFPAATTFNSWFVFGVQIDEAVITESMARAAQVGVELYQVDAGWYPQPRPRHAFDFSDGLGSWEVDAARFPNGLAALGDYARARGMKFGIWVEPERVALSTVGRAGMAEEAFLARQDGAYQPGTANSDATDAQICLAHPSAKAWVQARLFAFLDEVRPDNLKWDFNRWVHCTRADHDHPADGGNYEHTRALYDILAAVRARYPELTIENCSGGGHRLDFAMARLTDTAWMDDRSAPAAHVRGNLHGLLQAFPAPYLFSYVMPHASEALHGASDLPLLVRSRMPGVVGVAARLDELSEGEQNVLHQELELAKRLRPLQAAAITYVLTPQRPAAGEWEVVQQVDPATGLIHVFAYSDRNAPPLRVKLLGLRPDAIYELRSADRGVIGRLAGADLLAGGFEIRAAPESAAQVLVLQPVRDAQ